MIARIWHQAPLHFTFGYLSIALRLWNHAPLVTRRGSVRLNAGLEGRESRVGRNLVLAKPTNHFKCSPEAFRLEMMMDVRFPLSLRNAQDLLFERRIDIFHKAVRH